MSSLNEMISSREQLLNSYRGGGGGGAAYGADSFSNSRGGTTLLGLQMSSHFGPGEGVSGARGSVSKLTAASSSLALAA